MASAAAGPSTTVRRLAQSLGGIGVSSEIFSTSLPWRLPDDEPGVRIFRQDFANVPIFRRLHVSGAMRRGLEEVAAQNAVLHSHGLWLFPNFYPAWAATRHGCPLIVSPRGMIAPAALAFSRRRKALIWALAQRRALESVSCFHATSVQEAQEIRSAGLGSPIAVIPNGIDVPPEAPKQDTSQPRVLLHLGRIHPKKGIDRLLDSWARLEREHHQWSLRVVGPSEGGHRQELERQAARLGLSRVNFEDALFGAAKDSAYREADLFVLPTRNENFGMVVAEALANGTPVICTKGAPWRELETNHCGWWIDHGVDALTGALDSAMRVPRSELNKMGARGRLWMKQAFSWESVAVNMLAVYRWCRGESEKPEFVLSE